MNFKREDSKELYLHDTQVENIFITEYMPGADGLFIKVYLIALMYAGNAAMSNTLIAKHLGVDEEDVLRAWNYWESCGVVRKHYLDPADRFHYVIEFVNIKDRLYGSAPETSEEDFAAKAVREEMDDTVLRELFDSVQEITNRMLEAREPAKIISWLADDKAEPDMICYAYRYCTQRGKNNLAYVSAVIDGWIREDIRTSEDAQKYLAQTDERHNRYRRVMKALGFHRSATENEESRIDSWFDELGFDMDKVLEACAKTSGISNPNINYVNSILTSWAGSRKPKNGASAGAGSGGGNAVLRVKRLYEDIRNRHAEELENHRREVSGRAPRMLEIEKSERQTVMTMSKLALSGGQIGGITSSGLKDKMKALSREKTDLLKELGYPEDYLEMHYDCLKCHDTGVLDNGERCECFGEKLKKFM